MQFSLPSWWHRKRIKTQMQLARRPVEAHRVTNPYHAVSIKAGPSCAETGVRYGGRRYLSREAPRLPLPTCDARTCRFRYVHHDDRRSGFDRRHRDVWDPSSALARGGNRRRSHGRRVTDR